MSLQSLETDFGSSTTIPDFFPKNSTFPGFFRKNRQSIRRRFASGSYDHHPKVRIQTSNSEIFLFENFKKELNKNEGEEISDDVDLTENYLKENVKPLNGLLNENVKPLNGLLNENVKPLNGLLNENVKPLNGDGIEPLENNIKPQKEDFQQSIENNEHLNGNFQPLKDDIEHLNGNIEDLPSISSTLYARVFRKNVFPAAFSTYT